MQRTMARMSFMAAIVALVMSSGYRSIAQAPGPQTARQLRSSDRPAVFDDAQWSPEDDMQLLKTDLKSQKKQIVAANMGLTDAEAEKFWPVYDRYAADQANIYDTRLAIIPVRLVQTVSVRKSYGDKSCDHLLQRHRHHLSIGARSRTGCQ